MRRIARRRLRFVHRAEVVAIAQRLPIAGAKLGIWVRLICAELQQLLITPEVRLEILGVLRIDCVHLSRRRGWRAAAASSGDIPVVFVGLA